jgi:DNA end-binding protein Ku
VLREALRKSGKAGIATMILREKQHLCAIEVSDKAMVLTMMRFAEELVDVADLSLPSKELVKDKEMNLAMMLIDSLTSEWAPDKYKDEYRENLMKVIKAKLKGKEPKLKATDQMPGQAEVIDLMERLRESLGASKARAKAAAKSGRSTTRKRAAGPAKRPRPAAVRARKTSAKRARKAA